jgi:hypothetical protein
MMRAVRYALKIWILLTVSGGVAWAECRTVIAVNGVPEGIMVRGKFKTFKRLLPRNTLINSVSCDRAIPRHPDELWCVTSSGLYILHSYYDRTEKKLYKYTAEAREIDKPNCPRD